MAAAAVSISGGIVADPDCVTVAGDGGGRVELASVEGVEEGVGLPVRVAGRPVAVRLGVRDAVRVAVAGAEVGEGPGVLVRDGVRLGPEVDVAVRVDVREGVRVGVRVKVAVRVGVRVAVLVAEAAAVEEAVEVDVGGGAVTVKVPPLSVRGTDPAPGSEATAFPGVREETPGLAARLTLNDTVARVPSGIAEFPPWMTMRTTADDGWDQLSDFPAEEAAPPIVTPSTESRLASNPRSNWMAET